MCVRAVQFNMEKTDEKTGPARAEVGGGGGGRRTEAEMQAAPCESLGTTTLLGGVECRWLPYPTGQPVKLRYHLTRTLRPCTTNIYIYIYLNLRRWTFQRYLRVMIHLFSLSICEFSLSRFRKFFLYFFRFLPFSSSFSFKEEEEEEDGFALLANR